MPPPESTRRAETVDARLGHPRTDAGDLPCELAHVLIRHPELTDVRIVGARHQHPEVAMVALHKEQFGRGPTRARTDFAGPDAMLCVLEDVLLPAELKLAAMEEQDRVRESRTAFQAATGNDFVTAVERITQRRVQAFASGIDPDSNVVFECFYFTPREVPLSDGDGNAPS